MSLSVSTDVHCDECGAWVDGAVDTKMAASAARRAARLAGWKRIRGRDICPDCRESALQEVERKNYAIGVVVKRRRGELDMTQEELAGRTGRSRTTITNIESGTQGVPLELLMDLAAALGTDAQTLLQEAEV